MLHTLLRRAGTNAARVHTHCADARTWQPANPPYDLVATHFFLDCLSADEVRSLADRLREALSPSGLWVVSEFAIPEGAFGRWVARPVVWLLYRAFALLTGLAVRNLPNHSAALRAAGFTLRQRRSFLRGLLVAELWAAAVKTSSAVVRSQRRRATRSQCYKSVKIGLQGARHVLRPPPDRSP